MSYIASNLYIVAVIAWFALFEPRPASINILRGGNYENRA